MGNKTFLLFVLTILMALPSYGAVEVRRRDLRLPTQELIEKQSIVNPAAGGTNQVLTTNQGPTSAAVTEITSFAAQPDVPRNILITPGSTTANVEACVVTVTGTNIKDAVITETFAFADNASSATTGAKAFKTITSASWAAGCETSPYHATWTIGYGEKLGLSKCLDDAGNWLHSSVSGTKETTAATIVADADEVEKNTADFNGSMDGSADFNAYYIQNFRCSR